MQQALFIISLFVITACGLNQSETKTSKIYQTTSFDTCFKTIYVDSFSVETNLFRELWSNAEKWGYSFKDDTIVPFVKVIFQPQPAKFYTDTLLLDDCRILDSLNIHSMEITGRNKTKENLYPTLRMEEWKFKNSQACLKYSKGIEQFYKKELGLKSPVLIYQSEAALYIFKTAAYIFIPELEKLSSTLNPLAKEIARNY